MELETPEIEKETKAIKKNTKFTKYEDPKLAEFIIEARNKGASWEDVTKTVHESGWKEIHKDTVKKVYNRTLAKSVMVERKTGEKFDEFGLELKKLFKRVLKTLDSQLRKIEKIDNVIDEVDLEDPRVLIQFVKLAPMINSTNQQIFQAIKVYQEQQDKITEEIKGAIWDDGKLLDKMDDMLKNLKKEGWVIIPPKV